MCFDLSEQTWEEDEKVIMCRLGWMIVQMAFHEKQSDGDFLVHVLVGRAG